MKEAQTTTQPVLGSPPALKEGDEQEALVTRLAEEMTLAWSRGQHLVAETFLDRHPSLWHAPAAVLDLVYEEICLRQEYHEPVSRSELTRRFPAWRAQIEVLLTCAQALEGATAFPSAGEAFGDFLLLAELGRGAQGRVFLATDSSLGDRPVVLKITARGGEEHLSLARLQHTHIVPLLSVLDVPERNLRALCMPYFGGLTLAAVLAGLKDSEPGRRNGQQILDILDAARAREVVVSLRGRDPVTPFLGQASYEQAICWLGACLAEALKYAHERGLVHLDLKPSNVLLTADRQPMLLDFHLAQEALEPGARGIHFGGTPGYMSPEQAQAIAAIRQHGTVTDTIDGRSDIYSLGLVLYEALGGQFDSDAPERPRPLRNWNTHVSTGLADIIARCLASRPAERYADAGKLAGDLWAHLYDMPLKGVANRSLTERWRKWRRRQPHSLSLMVLVAAIFLIGATAICFAVSHTRHRLAEARQALEDGQRHVNGRQYGDAAHAFQRGLAQLANLPGTGDFREQLARGLDMTTRAQAAQDLHRIADGFRFLYGSSEQSSSRLKELAEHAESFWERRREMLKVLGNNLGPALERDVQLDMLDLAILGSNLRVSLAPPERRPGACRDALQRLAEAETLFGPSRVLFHERRLLAESLGESALAGALRQLELQHAPRTAWEHYALGRSLLRTGDAAGAAAQFEEAVRKEPGGLWPNFYMGICSYRLGRFLDAAEAFTSCIAQAPHNAGCLYNRALAYRDLGRRDLARRDLESALQIDPVFTEARNLLAALRKQPG